MTSICIDSGLPTIKQTKEEKEEKEEKEAISHTKEAPRLHMEAEEAGSKPLPLGALNFGRRLLAMCATTRLAASTMATQSKTSQGRVGIGEVHILRPVATAAMRLKHTSARRMERAQQLVCPVMLVTRQVHNGRIGLSYYHVIKRFFPRQAFGSKTALRYPRYMAKKQRFCETYILL